MKIILAGGKIDFQVGQLFSVVLKTILAGGKIIRKIHIYVPPYSAPPSPPPAGPLFCLSTFSPISVHKKSLLRYMSLPILLLPLLLLLLVLWSSRVGSTGQRPGESVLCRDTTRLPTKKTGGEVQKCLVPLC